MNDMATTLSTSLIVTSLLFIFFPTEKKKKRALTILHNSEICWHHSCTCRYTMPYLTLHKPPPHLVARAQPPSPQLLNCMVKRATLSYSLVSALYVKPYESGTEYITTDGKVTSHLA